MLGVHRKKAMKVLWNFNSEFNKKLSKSQALENIVIKVAESQDDPDTDFPIYVKQEVEPLQEIEQDKTYEPDSNSVALMDYMRDEINYSPESISSKSNSQRLSKSRSSFISDYSRNVIRPPEVTPFSPGGFKDRRSIMVASSFRSKQLNDSFDTVNDNRHGFSKYVYNTPSDKIKFMKDDFSIIDFIKAEPILRNIYSDISTLDFNIFDLKKETNGNELFFMVHYLMTIENFYEKLSIDPEVFKRYALGIQSHYNDVTYHNKTHAADVT